MSTDIQEEHFGILTDDNLYLDCILVRPAGVADDELQAIRVWVPRFPLTKSSTILCARQEVAGRGPGGQVAHLTFDLRGSGESDGSAADDNYEVDLHSIKAWAEERFGPALALSFSGIPVSQFGRINMLPMRSNVVMETYFYAPRRAIGSPPVLYLSSFGNFDRLDDVRCASIARAGYEVYALDPLRYLLGASTQQPLTAADLAADFKLMVDIIAAPPLIIGQPLGAGLALLWGALSERTAGVIAIGQAQAAFRAGHIFATRPPAADFELAARVPDIAPRPLALVWHEGHPLGGAPREMADLFQQAAEPKRIERTREISPQLLIDLLAWLVEKG